MREALKNVLFICCVVLLTLLGFLVMSIVVPAGLALVNVVYDLVTDWGSTLCTTGN